MFEESDGTAASTGRRGSRLTTRKDVSRNGSFRGTKKLKTEDGSPVVRSKQISASSLHLPLWQKLRNFGHYDLQSMKIERLANDPTTERGPAVKKPTGASAAHNLVDKEPDYEMCNALVASCPAFKNEIGGDSDWLVEGSPMITLRKSLSHEKQKRVGSREKLVLDGDLPLYEVLQSRGPMSRQASGVFQPQSGIHYPFEYIDYGASYYRNYFIGQGECFVYISVCVCENILVLVCV